MASFSHVWVRRDSPYTSWKGLASSVVGVPAFQMSLAVVARADMAEVEGVSWHGLTWATTQPESVELDVPVRPIEAPSLFAALQSGEIDAILTPEDGADGEAWPPRSSSPVVDQLSHRRASPARAEDPDARPHSATYRGLALTTGPLVRSMMRFG